MFEVKFADIGEGLTEGKVTEVLVKVGDQVKMGDSLFHVETDKVNSEIPAPVAGKVSEILIKADQEIKVGQVVVLIDDGSASAAPEKETKKVEVEEENASVVGSTPASNEVISRREEVQVSTNNNHQIKATPLARKVAADKNIDLKNVTGTGPNGRILVADLANVSVAKPIASIAPINHVSAPEIVAAKPVGKPGPDYNNPKISVREINEQLSFDTKPMNGIRKATVKAMTLSHTKNAAFTGMKSIDITNLVEARNQLKVYADSQNVKLTYLAFIAKAVARALKEMPNINVRIDEANNSIQYLQNVNIGIAVDTPDGLMVPVIKGVDQLTVLEIAVKITELANKAKNKKLGMLDMKDGTFTISNFGTVGLDFATPIINSPESAILGIGNMVKTPMYIGEEIKPRWIMPFSATADHRIIDGADAGRFLSKVEYYLQNPLILLV
ncbi:pyruvate dehydrogenase E2 component (dihydrolipoamide acetyltransferase) [Williamsoniiplasma somnilux]|uniref:Dihydrolipoamide acetyltransferase component of pyruvate dehydrogenase complex n=1 Tax=Williamsoniiplasma somnilux TaxID=215578 RepID=A0A2K8P1P3_9MOLU|nr:dihydrolipoamide acetyltransferase family protein [Williamsoniiplasma somnilux]ATZ18931.1 pyruvate dehydrogenase E2 component (dihydrolipoamide acetyltransferase) [Williamsoniiplasma somnilux]